MGLGDFLKGAGNVVKGAAFVANPKNWDDVAKGAGEAIKGVGYLATHPEYIDDAAKMIAKETFTMENLGETAALALATGGMGLIAGKVGSFGVKAADAAGDIAKASKALEKGADVARAGEKAADVAQAGAKASRLERFSQGVKEVGTGIKESKGLERVDRALNAPRELMGAGREAVGMSRYGKLAELRSGAAEKVLGQGDLSGPGGAARKAIAREVAGGTNPLTPERAQTTMSQMSTRVGRIREAAAAPGKANKAAEVAADPQQAAMDAATKASAQGMGPKGTGYVDRGQAAESLYGGGGEGPPPTAGEYQAAGEPLPQPGDYSSSTQRRVRGSTFEAMQTQWKPQQHFWEGPGREALGGIRPNYNWRAPHQLRKIEAPSVLQAGAYAAEKAKLPMNRPSESDYQAVTDWAMTMPGSGQGQSTLNEQGAPVNFAPEVPKSGMYAQSRGQQPVGTNMPHLPDIAQPTKRLFATVREPGEQAFGAIGPVKTPNQVLDVDSSEPAADFGFDDSGQGYFKFPEMGSAAVGQQPNVNTVYSSPAYQQGSRTARRQLGTGAGTGGRTLGV